MKIAQKVTTLRRIASASVKLLLSVVKSDENIAKMNVMDQI